MVKVWRTADASKKDAWDCACLINHGELEGRPAKTDNDADVPQVYALQFIDDWQGVGVKEGKNSFLMTSSDDFIHLWEIDEWTEKEHDWSLSEVISIRFTSLGDIGYGVSVRRVTTKGLDVGPASSNSNAAPGTAYGGERNPDNLIFVFDASYCPANGLLGAALSDGSVRLVNGRGVCISILTLPGCQSHLTSFAWDSTGSRLASCVASGHLILWTVDLGDGNGVVIPTCAAVMEGGECQRPTHKNGLEILFAHTPVHLLSRT